MIFFHSPPVLDFRTGTKDFIGVGEPGRVYGYWDFLLILQIQDNYEIFMDKIGISQKQGSISIFFYKYGNEQNKCKNIEI